MANKRDWIRANRALIDDHIAAALDRPLSDIVRNDDERELWLINDAGLYSLAYSEGVRL